MHAAVDPHSHEALATQLLEYFRVFALAIDDDGRQQQHGEAVRHFHDLVHHLAHGLRREIDAVIGAARDARACEQQA